MVIDLGNYEDNDGDDEGATEIEISEPEPIEEDDDDTGNVVVTGDPSEGEDVTTVGVGDTQEEARQDAATNPDFDADTGDPVNEIEKEMGTNQPLQNPEGSSNQEIRKAAEEIAGSEKYQGERIGRQAGELADVLRNNNRQPRNPRPRNMASPETTPETQEVNPDNIPMTNNRRRNILPGQNRNTTRNAQNSGNFNNSGVLQSATDFNLYDESNASKTRADKTTDIGTFVNPAKGNPNATFTEESITAGVDLMQKGQRTVDALADDLSTRDNFQADAGSFFVPITNTDIPQKVDDTNKSKEEIQEEAGLAPSEVTKGIGTFGTQAGGLLLATPGATKRSLEQDTPGIGTGAVTGFTLTGQQIQNDPVKFASSEVGEEIGEAAVGTAISGGAGAALAGTPSIELDAEGRPGQGLQKIRNAQNQARDIKNTAAGLVTGNLGTRPRQDQLISRDISTLNQQALEQRLNNLEPTGNLETSAEITQEVDRVTPGNVQDTTLLEETVETREDGATIRQIQGVQNGQAVQGRRIETPVTRREFAQDFLTSDRLGKAAALGLQGAAAASGAPTTTAGTGFSLETTPETTTDTTPETSPERLDPDTVFSTEQGVPEQSITPENSVTPALDPGLDDLQEQPPIENQPENQLNDEIQPPIENNPETVFPENTPEPQLEPERPQIDDFIQVDNTPRSSTTNDRGLGNNDDINIIQEDVEDDFVGGSEEGEFASSLTAGLFDITATEEDVNPENFSGTGLGIRPIIEEENKMEEEVDKFLPKL